ncbi:MAG TPA: PP2C family serine/threonine-protein phosphatase [Solirubrobacteraceae bacterium]|nr:PP2C family serine/threonine-protein phosphatase [Solirubrobacteraceae bacterium]
MSRSETVLACGTCQATLLPGDRYCERCGTRVGTAPNEQTRAGRGCAACGAPVEAIGAERYCSLCGVRQRSPQDRQEIDLIVAAGVSDRGHVRRRNEDALHLQTVGERGVAVVICDGISSSLSADVAARRGADAAGAVLAEALRGEQAMLAEAMTSAVGAAQQAVLEVPWTSRCDRDVPSCTLVSAVCRNRELVIGWVGDSRAYWIAGEDSCQLTVDDSWAQEQVAAGLLSVQEAGADKRAHSITRWLGHDAPDEEPQILTLRPTEPGRLVLCSDGLWNYTPAAAGLAAQLDALPPGTAAITAAHSLADAALSAGGHDNITVAVLNMAPPGEG